MDLYDPDIIDDALAFLGTAARWIMKLHRTRSAPTWSPSQTAVARGSRSSTGPVGGLVPRCQGSRSGSSRCDGNSRTSPALCTKPVVSTPRLLERERERDKEKRVGIGLVHDRLELPRGIAARLQARHEKPRPLVRQLLDLWGHSAPNVRSPPLVPLISKPLNETLEKT